MSKVRGKQLTFTTAKTIEEANRKTEEINRSMTPYMRKHHPAHHDAPYGNSWGCYTIWYYE